MIYDMQFANMSGQDVYTDHYHRRIHCRSGHVAVKHREHMLVWAGFMEHPGGHQSEYLNTDEVLAYNSSTEVWSRVITGGDVPHKNSGACGVVLDDSLYVFGGFQEIFDHWNHEANINHLYRLDLKTMVWERIQNAGGITPLACDKLAGWTYNGKLYFFGGFGPAPENPLDVPFMHIPSIEDTRVRGWNNQLVCFDPDKNEWSWPSTKGTTPCPRAAHAVDITGHKLYLFGGRLRDHRMGSLHCLNMELMEWSSDLSSSGDIAPEGRSWHSFTFINSTTAILYGGFSQQSMILNDCWQLHVGGVVTWEEVNLAYDHGHPRFFHISVCGEEGELLIHGGFIQPFYQLEFYIQEHANRLLKLHFKPKSLLRLCLDAAVENFIVTSPEWHTLPETLKNILVARLEQV